MKAVHHELAERLEMLPAVQCADAAEGKFMDQEVCSIALAIYGALHMCGFQLTTISNDRSLGIDEDLAHVARRALTLAIAHDDGNRVPRRGNLQSLHSVTTKLKRGFVMWHDKLSCPFLIAEPDPPGITGNEHLREGDDLGAFSRGPLNEFDRLGNRRIGVEPHRFCLDDCGLNN